MLKRKRIVVFLLSLAVLALLLAACGTTSTEESTEQDGNLQVAADHEEESENAEHHDEEEEHGHDATSHVEAHEEGHGHDLTSHEPIEGAEEIRVVATEWGFEPSTIHLHEGEATNITLVNQGLLEHEIELEAFDFHLHTEPGASVTAGLVPETTGDFEFACFLTGHYENGMVGEVAVAHGH